MELLLIAALILLPPFVGAGLLVAMVALYKRM